MVRVEGIFLVLPDHIGHDEFLRVAQDQGWIKQQTRDGDGERISHQEIWTTLDNANAINYVDDPLTLTRHIWVRGSQLQDILTHIWKRLPAYEPEELLEMANKAEDHDEAIQAVFRIAVAFPNFNPDAFKVFESYLKNPDALLRKATIQAIAYRLWSESVEMLESIVQNDSDEGVRQFAQSILNNL